MLIDLPSNVLGILCVIFSLQQYARGKIEAKESVDTAECDDEETTPVKEQKSTSMFSNICVSYSAPSEEGEAVDRTWNSLELIELSSTNKISLV